MRWILLPAAVVCMSVTIARGADESSSSTLVLTVRAPGMSAEEADAAVARPLVTALRAPVGATHIQARSERDRVTLWLQVPGERRATLQKAAKAIRDVDLPKGLYPAFRESAGPVFLVGLKSETKTRRELRITAEPLAFGLRMRATVGVRVLGPPVEIRITLDPEKLRAHALTAGEVAKAVSAEPWKDGNIFRRVEAGDCLPNVQITTRNGQAILVKDVGVVEEAAERHEPPAIEDGGKPLSRDVLLAITTRSDADLAVVAKAIRDAIAEAKLPEDVIVENPMPEQPAVPHAAIVQVEDNLPPDMTLLGSQVAGVGTVYKPVRRGDFVVKVFVADGAARDKAMQEMRASLSRVPGVSRVETWPPIGTPTLKMVTDRDRAARLGVSAADIVDELNAFAASVPVGFIQAGDLAFCGGAFYRIVVGLPDRWRTADEMGKLMVKSQDGKSVPLSEVAQVKAELEPDNVYSIDGERTSLVFVYAQKDLRDKALAEVKRVTAATTQPAGVRVEVGE